MAQCKHSHPIREERGIETRNQSKIKRNPASKPHQVSPQWPPSLYQILCLITFLVAGTHTQHLPPNGSEVYFGSNLQKFQFSRLECGKGTVERPGRRKSAHRMVTRKQKTGGRRARCTPRLNPSELPPQPDSPTPAWQVHSTLQPITSASPVCDYARPLDKTVVSLKLQFKNPGFLCLLF